MAPSDESPKNMSLKAGQRVGMRGPAKVNALVWRLPLSLFSQVLVAAVLRTRASPLGLE